MDIKRALTAVGGGANEFVVKQAALESPGWTAFAVVSGVFVSGERCANFHCQLYHQAFVSLRISSGSLLALAGKSTSEDADISRQEVRCLCRTAASGH